MQSTSAYASPLLLACSQNDCATVSELLARGADPNASELPAPRSSGSGYAASWNALHIAAHAGYRALMSLLLDAGADANARHCARGFAPIHISAERGDSAAVELLLSHGADPLAERADGATAASLAAEQGIFPLARLLLQRCVESKRGLPPARVLMGAAVAPAAAPAAAPRASSPNRNGEGEFILYRYISCESFSQFDLLPVTSFLRRQRRALLRPAALHLLPTPRTRRCTQWRNSSAPRGSAPARAAGARCWRDSGTSERRCAPRSAPGTVAWSAFSSARGRSHTTTF